MKYLIILLIAIALQGCIKIQIVDTINNVYPGEMVEEEVELTI